MSIYSLVVHTRPENVESVKQELIDIDGVEVHATNDKGKLVVTLDHPDRTYCSDTIMNFHNISGVLNSSLVYEYFEDSQSNTEPSPNLRRGI